MADNEEREWLKIVGTVILLLPVAMFLIFSAGEVLGGDIGGLQHLVEAGATALVALFAWRWPALIGSFLVTIGGALTLLYFYDQHGKATPTSLALTELIFFAPVLLAGVLFLVAARRDREHSVG